MSNVNKTLSKNLLEKFQTELNLVNKFVSENQPTNESSIDNEKFSEIDYEKKSKIPIKLRLNSVINTESSVLTNNTKETQVVKQIPFLKTVEKTTPTLSEITTKIYNDYIKKLSILDFPNISYIYFKEEDCEKLFKFFDHIIHLKSNIHQEKISYNNTINNLQNQLASIHNNYSLLEKELFNKDQEAKQSLKFEINSNVQTYKKQFDIENNNLKSEITKLKNKVSTLQVEKQQLNEKLNSITEAFNKVLYSKKEKPKNGIEILENLKKNNLLKRLESIEGSEKLVESFQNRLDCTFKKLMVEINLLKTFLLKINDIILSIYKEKISKSKENEYNYDVSNLKQESQELSILDTFDFYQTTILNNLQNLKTVN